MTTCYQHKFTKRRESLDLDRTPRLVGRRANGKARVICLRENGRKKSDDDDERVSSEEKKKKQTFDFFLHVGR